MTAPQLKVVFPADAPPGPSEPTLRDVWLDIVQPRKRRRGIQRSTEGFYERALDDWDRFVEWSQASKDLLCAQQAVSSIDDHALQAYQDYLISRVSLPKGARTVNGRLDSIMALLRAAAEKRYIPVVPERPLKLDEVPPDPVQLTMEEISALYDACDVATWPWRSGPQADGSHYDLPYSPPGAWRFVIAWLFNYGFRPGELIGQSPKVAVRWSQVSFDAPSPSRRGKVDCDQGWFWYTPGKQRRRKPRPLILPMTAITRAHLQLLHPEHFVGRSTGPVLDWPRGNKQLKAQWEKIVAESGVEMKPDLETGELEPVHRKHFRSTCSSWLDEHEPGMSPYIVGHARDRTPNAGVTVRGGTDVSARHYVRQERAILKTLSSFPQPESFYKVFIA